MQALEPDDGENSSTSEIPINLTASETAPSQFEENAAMLIQDNARVVLSCKEPNVIDDAAVQALSSAGSVPDEFEPYRPIVLSETVTVSHSIIDQDESDAPCATLDQSKDQKSETVETLQPEPMDVGECVAYSYPDFIDDQNDANSSPPHPSHSESNVEFEIESIDIKMESSALEISTPEACIEETVTSKQVACEEDILKLDASSEDEEINFYLKSGAESCSSKEESPTGPSCSGTSRAGINSLSSDSEGDLPNINISLPLKKRKRETNVEIIATSSCSEDEGKCEEIDYANLKPEEIKALIEEARRYGNIKRKCKCPKKKWEDLPIKGPTQPSGKCTIGKGDWSENLSLPCAACSAGACHDNHRHGRRRRKGPLPRMSLLTKSRAKGTIGEDVPIIDLSDSEEVSPASNQAITEVKKPAIPSSGECIVLSSSEDDDIVCEGVIKTDVKNVVGIEPPAQSTGAPEKIDSPDVVVLNASIVPDASTDIIHAFTAGQFSEPPLDMTLPAPILPPPVSSVPQVPEAEPWPDCNIDLDNWDETFNFLANIAGPGALGPEVNANVAVPERPSTPEGWSCPICLEPKTGVNEIMSTTCGHVFCGNCIRSAVRLHKKCPTCRKKLTSKQFHKIFL